ncbi:MAG: hypothetical protein ABIQ31_02805 [Ferruginibacter sp.]
MNPVSKKAVKDITIALSKAISGETRNKKIKKAIDKSAKKLAKKVIKIKKATVKNKKKPSKKSNEHN